MFGLQDLVFFDYARERTNIPGKILRLMPGGVYDISPILREKDTFFGIPEGSVRSAPLPVKLSQDVEEYVSYRSVRVKTPGYEGLTGVVCQSPFEYFRDVKDFKVAFRREGTTDFEIVDVPVDQIEVKPYAVGSVLYFKHAGTNNIGKVVAHYPGDDTYDLVSPLPDTPYKRVKHIDMSENTPSASFPETAGEVEVGQVVTVTTMGYDYRNGIVSRVPSAERATFELAFWRWDDEDYETIEVSGDEIRLKHSPPASGRPSKRAKA